MLCILFTFERDNIKSTTVTETQNPISYTLHWTWNKSTVDSCPIIFLVTFVKCLCFSEIDICPYHSSVLNCTLWCQSFSHADFLFSCSARFTTVWHFCYPIPGSACNNLPCQNGGSCIETVSPDYYCLCATGWTGSHCETGKYSTCN